MRNLLTITLALACASLSLAQDRAAFEQRMREAPPESKVYLRARAAVTDGLASGDGLSISNSIETIWRYHPEKEEDYACFYVRSLVECGRDQEAVNFASSKHLFDYFTGTRALPGEDDPRITELDGLRKSLGLALARVKRYDWSRSLWDEKFMPMRHIDMLPYVPRAFKDKDLPEMWMLALVRDVYFRKQYPKHLAKLNPGNPIYRFWVACNETDRRPSVVDAITLKFIPQTRGHYRVFLERMVGNGNPQRTEAILKTVGLTPTVLKPGED